MARQLDPTKRKLTDIQCKSAKPLRDENGSTKPIKLSDGYGLNLEVRSDGKFWFYAFRLNGKQLKLNLGGYPTVRLSDAREMHQTAWTIVQDGEDPRQATITSTQKKRAQTEQRELEKLQLVEMERAIQKDPLQLQIRTQGTNRRRWLSRKEVSFKDGKLRPNTLFNQPVQGLAADGMKADLVVLQKRLEELDAKLVAVIHDEVIVQTPPPLVDQVQGIVEQAMIEGMQTFVSEVPITAEAIVGKSWVEK